jgi:hypothetical protein
MKPQRAKVNERKCVDCAYFRIRSGREGRVGYWCVLRNQELGDRMLWKRACKESRVDPSAADSNRDLP